MSLKRIALLTGTLATVLPACSDTCVDDGFSQDPAEDCPAAATAGSTGSDSTGQTDSVTMSGPTGPTTTVGMTGSGSTSSGATMTDTLPTTETDTDSDSDTDADTESDTDAGTCGNGEQDGDETDVDCGGSCDGCDDGAMCEDDEDCASALCSLLNVCEARTCLDLTQNGGETDVDCGGPDCAPCGDGSGCEMGSDCVSDVCTDEVCAAPTCEDGATNGDETGEDCGGSCDPCGTGEACDGPADCDSGVCGDDDTCSAPACDDGVLNGDESDVDCGGDTCEACDPGEMCTDADDCVSANCDGLTMTCGALLTVEGAPSCSTSSGGAVTITAVAEGGAGGPYTYSWAPNDGTLSTPNAQSTEADPSGVASYEVTASDGVTTATDSVTVVNSDPFDLENNCTLFQGDFGGTTAATIDYDMNGTRACELGNNQFGLHLCEGVEFESTQLLGRLEVTDAAGDDDFIGLVWGAQDSSHFYSMTWKGGGGMSDDCLFPPGITVKRVEADTFEDIVSEDLHCSNDTDNSVLLLTPLQTTIAPWSDDTSYTVAIDFTPTGSDISITQDSDNAVVANFSVADTTFTSGFFGSTTRSQENACVGPLQATCL